MFIFSTTYSMIISSDVIMMRDYTRTNLKYSNINIKYKDIF